MLNLHSSTKNTCVPIAERFASKKSSDQKPTTVEFGTPDRVDWHLHNWTTWMHTGRSVDRLPSRSMAIGNSHSTSFDDMVDASDIRCAGITDAIISDLPPAQSCAVACKYLCSIYRFQRDNYIEMLDLAKKAIGIQLGVRGVY